MKIARIVLTATILSTSCCSINPNVSTHSSSKPIDIYISGWTCNDNLQLGSCKKNYHAKIAHTQKEKKWTWENYVDDDHTRKFMAAIKASQSPPTDDDTDQSEDVIEGNRHTKIVESYEDFKDLEQDSRDLLAAMKAIFAQREIEDALMVEQLKKLSQEAIDQKNQHNELYPDAPIEHDTFIPLASINSLTSADLLAFVGAYSRQDEDMLESVETSEFLK
jgi:hypothetical protein